MSGHEQESRDEKVNRICHGIPGSHDEPRLKGAIEAVWTEGTVKRTFSLLYPDVSENRLSIYRGVWGGEYHIPVSTTCEYRTKRISTNLDLLDRECIKRQGLGGEKKVLVSGCGKKMVLLPIVGGGVRTGQFCHG